MKTVHFHGVPCGVAATPFMSVKTDGSVSSY